jgi:hypothetical protein
VCSTNTGIDTVIAKTLENFVFPLTALKGQSYVDFRPNNGLSVLKNGSSRALFSPGSPLQEIHFRKDRQYTIYCVSYPILIFQTD